VLHHHPECFLLGDSTTDTTFRIVLDKPLSELVEELPEILVEDGEFVAARGAAELRGDLHTGQRTLGLDLWLRKN
jgi:hypothetical protein